jgi:hypothetical protein
MEECATKGRIRAKNRISEGWVVGGAALQVQVLNGALMLLANRMRSVRLRVLCKRGD